MLVVGEWMSNLTLQQQSVILLGSRGPDGIAKHHPCKGVVQAYRATVLRAGMYGRFLRIGECGDSFMCLRRFGNEADWADDVKAYLASVDELPHHYHLHVIHGAQILGYKHPNSFFRSNWLHFYQCSVNNLHLEIEDKGLRDGLKETQFGEEVSLAVYDIPTGIASPLYPTEEEN